MAQEKQTIQIKIFKKKQTSLVTTKRNPAEQFQRKETENTRGKMKGEKTRR